MRNTSKISKIIILTILVCACGMRLWGFSTESMEERNTKAELQVYFPLQAEEPITLLSEPAYAETGDAPAPETYSHETLSHETHNRETPPAPEPIVNPFIQELQDEINSDIVAWLSIPGTKIDYPIVSTDNNEFYLRHDIHKKQAQAGSLFTDYRCAPDFLGFNTIVYGHNMKNRSMFGELRSFADAGFFEENRHGTLYTSTKTYSLEIFAFMVITSDDPEIYANPPCPEAFREYIKENARVYREPDAEPDLSEKILTLSTCAYERDNARIVVLATMREQ